MANIPTYKDAKFYICTTPQASDLDKAGFEALTWVQVDNVVSHPALTVTENMISQDYVDTDLSTNQKGFAKGKETALEVGYNSDDPGQIAMRAAADTRFEYAVKSELADAPDASTTNSIKYTRCVIGQPEEAGGGGEDFVNDMFALGINQRPILAVPEAI